MTAGGGDYALTNEAYPDRLRELAAGPTSSDPHQQLDYIEEVVQLVNELGHPRVKPIKKKLNQAFAKLGEGVEAGHSAEDLAKDLATDLQELRRQTYDLLNTVVTQLRTHLRAQQSGMSPAEREEAKRLYKGLALFAQAMRQMGAASRNDDQGGREKAVAKLEEAEAALGGTGDRQSE